MNQGVACMAAQRPHSAARNWVVRLFDTAQHSPGPHCTVGGVVFLKNADLRSVCSNEFLTLELNTDKRSAAGETKLPAATARRWSAGSGLLGSVCMSCFVIPANWPSLHPTLPYQGMARGGNRP